MTGSDVILDKIRVAVRRDHGDCMLPTCEVAAALAAGFPLAAAHLLASSGAEVPALAQVVRGSRDHITALGNPLLEEPTGYADWVRYAEETGRMCPACNAVTFADSLLDCVNCGGTLPAPVSPDVPGPP